MCYRHRTEKDLIKKNKQTNMASNLYNDEVYEAMKQAYPNCILTKGMFTNILFNHNENPIAFAIPVAKTTYHEAIQEFLIQSPQVKHFWLRVFLLSNKEIHAQGCWAFSEYSSRRPPKLRGKWSYSNTQDDTYKRIHVSIIDDSNPQFYQYFEFRVKK